MTAPAKQYTLRFPKLLADSLRTSDVEKWPKLKGIVSPDGVDHADAYVALDPYADEQQHHRD